MLTFSGRTYTCNAIYWNSDEAHIFCGTLSFVYTDYSLRRSRAARIWRAINSFSANLRRAKDTRCMERMTRRIQFYLCSQKKLTNFGSQRMVCELFADGAAQVRSLVYTDANLVRKPCALMYTRLYLFNKHPLLPICKIDLELQLILWKQFCEPLWRTGGARSCQKKRWEKC